MGDDAIKVPVSKRTKKPFECFHRHYEDNVERWKVYAAILDGFEKDRDKRNALPQFPYELDDLYAARLKASHFLGGAEVAVERLVGAVFASEPEFTSASEAVTAWMKDVDGDGTTLRDVLEESSEAANVFSVHFVLVTKTGPKLVPAVDGTPITKAQELAAGNIGVMVEPLSAFSVINWGQKENKITWASVRTVETESDSPNDAPVSYEKWRVVTASSITVYRRDFKNGEEDEESEPKFVETIDHNLGLLPLVPIYGRRRKKFQGKSYIKAAARADVAKFHEDSWGAQIRNVHANPILGIKSSRKLKEIYIGANAVRLEPDEEMAYINPNALPFDARKDASERYTREAIRVTGSNPTFTSDGLTFAAESGVAGRQRFEQTEQRYIKRHARGIEVAATKILDLAYLIFEDATVADLEGKNSAQVFDAFEVLDLGETTKVYRDVELSIDSPTFHKVAKTRIALGLCVGSATAEREAIKKEIEAAEKNATAERAAALRDRHNGKGGDMGQTSSGAQNRNPGL